MSTAVDICNLALVRIGQSVQITSITSPTTNEERLCALVYPIARDFVLREAPWNFATKTAALAGSTTGPALWAYQYDYPSDCIRVLKVLGGTSPRVDEPQPFEVFNSGSARKIATNQASASARYTMQVTDPTLFDTQFISALAMYLASELAVSLSQSPDTALKMREAYNAMKATFPAEAVPEADVTANASDTLTEVAIANAALLALGHSRTISSSSENTNESRLFNIFFPRVRDSILRAVPWNFASKRATLVTASSAAAVTNWTYKYTVPSDCVMARFLVGTGFTSFKFEIVHDATAGRVLHTDVASAVLSYTASITDEAQFDPLFANALIAGLAMAMGPALGAKPEVIAKAQENYNLIITQATAQNDKEGVTGPHGSQSTFTATVLGICNMALMKLGKSPIAALEEPTKEARTLGFYYEAIREQVLAAYPWSFATARVDLVENGTATVPQNWGYAFDLPTDCVVARAIEVPGVRHPTNDERIEFEIGVEDASATTKLLYCDVDPTTPPVLVYTTRLSSPSPFDLTFANAMAWRLAAETGAALGADPKTIQGCMIQYKLAVQDAAANNFNEGFEGPEPESLFISVR